MRRILSVYVMGALGAWRVWNGNVTMESERQQHEPTSREAVMLVRKGGFHNARSIAPRMALM